MDWVPIRKMRNHFLLVSDWTQIDDAPITDEKKAEWRTYRQALRDLPSDYADAQDKSEVVWPTKPV